MEERAIPKITLGRFPTPFEELPRLGRALGRRLYVKRDDLSGVSTGGNKVRKLEYLLADAIGKGADVVLTTGGAQSNHAMLTAACCNMLGLEAVLVLEARGATGRVGNLMIDELLGATVHLVDADSYDKVYAQMDRIEAELRAAGKKPYRIPVGGSVPLGTLGYVDCAKEIFLEARTRGVRIDRIVCTAGSGGTMAGLVLGARLYGDDCKVTGIAVGDEPFEAVVAELVNGAAELLGSGIRITCAEVDVVPCFGAGYALPSEEGLEAIRLMAQTEGLILDPVYTGKTMAGLITLCRNGTIGPEENVLFLHSGGVAAVFAIDPVNTVQ